MEEEDLRDFAGVAMWRRWDGGGRWTYIVCNPEPEKLYIFNYPPPIFVLLCYIEVGSKDGQQGIIFTSGEI